MPACKIMSRTLMALGAALITAATMPVAANAQAVDFLWGGDNEWFLPQAKECAPANAEFREIPHFESLQLACVRSTK